MGATAELEAARPMASRDAAEEGKRQLQRDERLKAGRAALERAIMKHEAANSWPRFLRGLRRDQAAVNESLLGAMRAVLGLLDNPK